MCGKVGRCEEEMKKFGCLCSWWNVLEELKNIKKMENRRNK